MQVCFDLKPLFTAELAEDAEMLFFDFSASQQKVQRRINSVSSVPRAQRAVKYYKAQPNCPINPQSQIQNPSGA
jgi:hypothetical protein